MPQSRKITEKYNITQAIYVSLSLLPEVSLYEGLGGILCLFNIII